MDRRPPRDAGGDRVYQAIKARVIAHDFPEGRRIFLQPLADSLGVSTTPVREALNRLTAEDLVIKAPRKGFIAMTLSQKDLLGYYDLTRLLLTVELQALDAAALRRMPEFQPIADVLNRLNRRVLRDPGVVAAYTGEVFYDIAAVRGNNHVMRSIGQANDQLYFIRTIECRQLENAQDELKLMCELLLAGRRDELLSVLNRYHERRVAMLPRLLKLAKR